MVIYELSKELCDGVALCHFVRGRTCPAENSSGIELISNWRTEKIENDPRTTLNASIRRCLTVYLVVVFSGEEVIITSRPENPTAGRPNLVVVTIFPFGSHFLFGLWGTFELANSGNLLKCSMQSHVSMTRPP